MGAFLHCGRDWRCRECRGLACRKAMKQIDDERYTEVLVQEGMRTIYKYGIACYRKNCKILCEVIQV